MPGTPRKIRPEKQRADPPKKGPAGSATGWGPQGKHSPEQATRRVVQARSSPIGNMLGRPSKIRPEKQHGRATQKKKSSSKSNVPVVAQERSGPKSNMMAHPRKIQLEHGRALLPKKDPTRTATWPGHPKRSGRTSTCWPAHERSDQSSSVPATRPTVGNTPHSTGGGSLRDRVVSYLTSKLSILVHETLCTQGKPLAWPLFPTRDGLKTKKSNSYRRLW